MWIKARGKDPAATERLQKLKERLTALDIAVSKGTDGRFTVCTTVEPLFCFVRDTEAEIENVVKDALRSYIENFYDIQIVKIETETVPVARSPLPIEELVPVSRVQPSFQYA